MSTAAPVLRPIDLLQLPTLAAFTLLLVFGGVGRWLDASGQGWMAGSWLVVGAMFTTALVRRVGLWLLTVAAPIAVLLLIGGQVLFTEPWVPKSLLAAAVPLYIKAFPVMASATAGAVLVCAVRLVRMYRGRRNDPAGVGRS
ncbi:hypothetical protein D5S17_08000 [Pseudonocardiaceae bacterium YIM PH 21723]|nr:hypothetical protein D5S17_08000 [Pseudonocardiaceae bacterium YIM PH 21723]